MDPFDRLAEILGFPLPEPLARIFREPPPFQELQDAEIESVARFESLFPGVPPRVLPLIEVGNGDHIGLYVPRDEVPPFLVDFDHAESIVRPLTGDFERFARDPDRYSPSHPANDWKAATEPDGPWRALRIDPASPAPGRELVKPLALHRDEFDRFCNPHSTMAETIFGPLIEAAREAPVVDPVDEVLRGLLAAPADLHDRIRWISAAEALVDLGEPALALRVLENVHAVVLGGYPYSGQREASSLDEDRRAGWPWTPVAELLERLLDLAAVHGDSFDRAALAHQLELAKAWRGR